MSKTLPIIALTPGDCTGIGPEQTARILTTGAWTTSRGSWSSAMHVSSSLAKARPALTLKRNATRAPRDVDWSAGAVPLVDLGNTDPDAFPPGVVSAKSGHVTGETLSRAIDFAKAGEVDAVTFAPLNKRAMFDGGWKFPDEHKMFAHLLGHKGYFSEMNVLDDQWMSRVTSHVSLRQALDQINEQSISDAIVLAMRQ